MHLTTFPTRLEIDPGAVSDEYHARGYDRLGDEELFALAARVVAIPKREPANSFVLHAPLELLARRALLRSVAPEHRTAVREQLVRIAARYEQAAEPIDPLAAARFAS